VLAVAGTLRAVPPDPAVDQRPHMDITGTVLLTVALVGLVFGLSQSQAWGWASPGVLVPLIISVCAGAAFVRAERAAASPLMSLPLLRRHPNHLGAPDVADLPNRRPAGSDAQAASELEGEHTGPTLAQWLLPAPPGASWGK
jgi:hypothetical protein